MDWRWFRICIVLLSMVTGTLGSNECSKENVNLCMEPMQEFELDKYTAIVPVFDEASLTSMCSQYVKSEVCMKDFMANCSPVDRFYFTAVEKSWDYICNETKKEYLRIKDCLTTPGLHVAGQKCSDQFKDRSEHIFNNSLLYTQKDKNNLICSYANTYLECVYTEVHRFCGERAADWQKGFDDVLIQSILRLIGCEKDGDVYYYPPDEKVSRTTLIIISISICSGITIMVLIALILLRTRKRPRNRQLFFWTAHRPSVVGGAEPYPEPGPDGSMPFMIYSTRRPTTLVAASPPPYLEKDAAPPSYQGASDDPGNTKAQAPAKTSAGGKQKSPLKLGLTDYGTGASAHA